MKSHNNNMKFIAVNTEIYKHLLLSCFSGIDECCLLFNLGFQDNKTEN